MIDRYKPMRFHRPQSAWLRAVGASRSRARRRRLLRPAIMVLLAAIVAVAGLIVSPGRAASSGTYLDSFADISFSGSSGTLDWSASPWVEIGESDGSGSGSVIVFSGTAGSPCYAGTNCLRINDTSSSVSHGARRSADLAGADSATLTFSYHLEEDNSANPTEFSLQVSSDPSGPWTTLATYVVTGTEVEDTAQSFDISEWISESTTIRFLSSATGDSDEIYLDNVQIEATADEPPTFDQDLGDRTDAEGDTVSFAATASDPEGDSLTYSATGLPQGIAIDSETGQVSGTIGHDAAASSPHSVVLTVTDPGGNSDTDTFTWTVTDVNRAPSLEPIGDQASAEGDTVSLTPVGTDPDGDSLSWSGAGLPAGLSIDSGTGVVSGVVDYDASGSSPHLVTIRATDDGSPVLWAEESFSWVVSDTNRAPALVDPGDQASGEGDTVSLTVEAPDPDGDDVTFEAVGLPAGLSIDGTTGVITGTVDFDASNASPYAVTIRATDDGSPVQIAEVEISWTVTDTNRPPDITSPGDQSSNEGDAISLTVSGSDPDGDGFVWSATGLPADLAIDPVSGVISGAIGYEAAGFHPVTVRATDDGSPVESSEVSFTWTVADANRPPEVTSPGDQSGAEADVIELAMVGSDPDGDDVSWSASGLPDGLAIDPTTGIISGTLSFESSGSHAVTVRATDDGSPPLFREVSFTWTVTNTNRSPVVTNPGNRSTAEGSPVTFLIAASDPDGDDLSWSATGLPQGLAIDPESGSISGTIAFSVAAASPYLVTVRATDDGALAASDEVSFTWTVTNTNRSPVVTNPGSQADYEGDAVSLPVAGSDLDGDDLSWSAAGLPDGLVIDSAAGTISGTLSFDSSGSHAVTVRAADDGSPSRFDEVSFTWTVTDTNRAPVVTDPGTRSAQEGDAVSVTITAVDPDGDSLTFASSGLPPGLTIDPETGLISGSLGYSLDDSYPVVVSVTDSGSPPLASQVSFTWNVMDVSRPLGMLIAGDALQWGPAILSDPSGVVTLGPSSATELILGTVVQSLYALRVPLALLSGAVIWSLLFGGILNLGFAVRRGLPTLVRRTSRSFAAVMARHGERVAVLDRAGDGAPIWRYTATERGLTATGRRIDLPDGTWAEIETPNGRGWVPLINLTEEVDRAGFADDPEPMVLLREFILRLRAQRDFSDLVSMHGLSVAHHGPPIRFPREQSVDLMEDPSEYRWRGRSPAYPDVHTTFDVAVATGILDAWDHPLRQLLHDSSAVPSTVIPVEFTNFHLISIGADVHGPERLDQSAWVVLFSYEGGRARIVGLVKEG